MKPLRPSARIPLPCARCGHIRPVDLAVGLCTPCAQGQADAEREAAASRASRHRRPDPVAPEPVAPASVAPVLNSPPPNPPEPVSPEPISPAPAAVEPIAIPERAGEQPEPPAAQRSA